MGGPSSRMAHFSSRPTWWGRRGVVASRYSLGTSRRLSLPWVTCAGRGFRLGRANPLFSDNGRGAQGCCAHSPIFDCSFRHRAVFGPRILFAKGFQDFSGRPSICERLHFSRRQPSARAGYRSLQQASKIGADGLAKSHNAQQANATSRTMLRADGCASRRMPKEVGDPLRRW